MSRWESEEAIIARINRMERARRGDALKRIQRRRRLALARWRRTVADLIVGKVTRSTKQSLPDLSDLVFHVLTSMRARRG